jgi:nitrogenase molybdenum-iron protein alpha/beta subunit
MNSKPSPWNTSRTGGCTLTGALSVTSAVRDCISIVHGPAGCAHHNFSLLHATALDQDAVPFPHVRSTGLLEEEIIFGGEVALETAIRRAADEKPGLIAVLSTCVSETIGDDARAVAAGVWGVPVVTIPTAGFLGGDFEQGVAKALLSLADLAGPVDAGDKPCVTLVGEKNLEYEVDQHYDEIRRLLGMLGIKIGNRFVRNTSVAEVRNLGGGGLNVLRDRALVPVGEALSARFATPYLGEFPIGFVNTIGFLHDAGSVFGIDPADAIGRERELQEDIIGNFSDLRGCPVRFGDGQVPSADPGVRELVGMVGLRETAGGCRLPVPVPFPVGTAGARRLLHRWRRAIHARA